MIAVARFGAARARVRRMEFVARAPLPIGAACAIARAVEGSLRELFGACELSVGEPVALSAHAWRELTRDALVYLRRGRPADAAIVIPAVDARRLVLHAFGEPASPATDAAPACSSLERRALERIAARCGATLEPVCDGGASPGRIVAPADVPACEAYVDLRVRAPVALTLGVAVTRALADPMPAATLSAGALGHVSLEARAVFAEGILDAADFVNLRPGHVVKLDTKVGAPASLNCGPRRLATGVAGVIASRTAFLVNDVATGVSG